MSKLGFSYCQPLLLAYIYIWDNTYNTFHLPCGMMTPTLFYIVAITGLPQTGETFDPYLQLDNTINFQVKNSSFTAYMNLYHTKGDEVTDVEHIAFLAFHRWIG